MATKNVLCVKIATDSLQTCVKILTLSWGRIHGLLFRQISLRQSFQSYAARRIRPLSEDCGTPVRSSRPAAGHEIAQDMLQNDTSNHEIVANGRTALSRFVRALRGGSCWSVPIFERVVLALR